MLRNVPKWMLALSLGLFVVGCSDDDDDKVTTPTNTPDEFALVSALGDTYFTDYTTPSGQPVNVTAATVFQNMTARAEVDYHILDWRSSTDFDRGHIDGAINVSVADFDAVVAAIPDDVVVLNVCYTGQTASHTTAYLNMLGFEAQNLKFGMCGWTREWSDGTTTTRDKWDGAISDDYVDWLFSDATAPTETNTSNWPETLR